MSRLYRTLHLSYVKDYIWLIVVLGLVCVAALIIYMWIRSKKEHYSNYTNNETLSEKKAAIIVEPRKHKLLAPVLKNFNARLDSSWDMYIFHGSNNKEYVEESVADIIKDDKRKIILKSLNTDNLSAEQYNKLFKDPAFWNQIDAEHILVFQTDAVSCANSQQSIDSFLKYGYIGCSSGNAIGVHPASFWGGNDVWLGKGSMKNYPFYGVGGLSLRKKSFTMDCIRKMSEYPAEFPEDVFYSICVERPENEDMRPQTAREIQDFCTQGSYNEQHDSWGAHKTNDTIPESSAFYGFCPEAKILFNP